MSFSDSLLTLLGRADYAPLRPDALAERLGVPPAKREAFQTELDQLLQSGRIIALKKGRLALPEDADLIVGTIRFRAAGSADVHPDPVPGRARPTPIPVRSEDTAVALHGDRVVARRMAPERRARYRREVSGRAAPMAERETARVIRILERAREVVTGTLQRSKTTWYVVPDDPRITQDILVPDPATSGIKPAPRSNDKVVVRLAEWEHRHLNPEGEIERVLGRTHEPRAEYEALLIRQNLSAEFPADVLAEAERLPDRVPASDLKGRRDLRKQLVLTIDPDDAKDFDDALSVEPAGNGQWTVGIHIADVSAYVKPGSALDREARRRGNSTYLVGTVLPMLPHNLSDGLCSLVEGEDRLTQSAFITLNEGGKILRTEFASTVIRSRKRLTYKQAYALLNEDDLDKIKALPAPPAHQTGATGRPLAKVGNRELGEIQESVRRLWSLAARLRARRFHSGSLDLDMPEMKIFVDAEGHADRIERIVHDESHQLVEEFMLAANEAVARHLLGLKRVLLHRVHDDPEPEKLVELREQLAAFGIATGDLSERRNITKLLDTLRGHPQAQTLRVHFLRSLKQACYRATPDGHYGLAKKYYTHFTSPIRRYADLVVHRVLTEANEAGQSGKAKAVPKGQSLAALTDLAAHLSRTEQNSTEAERESVKIKLLEFFERELSAGSPRRFDAAIMEIRNHGLFIELSESSAFGFVHISTLTDDFYVLADDGTEIVGRRNRRRYAVGQIIQVAVDRVDRFKRQIDFRIAAPSASDERPQAKDRRGSGSGRSDGRPDKAKRTTNDKSRAKVQRGKKGKPPHSKKTGKGRRSSSGDARSTP